jgi:hypothetical protein
MPREVTDEDFSTLLSLPPAAIDKVKREIADNLLPPAA